MLDALEQFAPLPLQEDYDNAGLQVGLTEAEVSGALLCLDVTEAVVDEAVAKGCNLVVSHHPLIFRRLAHITGENYVQRAVIKAIKNNITIAAMHTNLDSAEGGVNFKMAEKLGLANVRFIGSQKESQGVSGGTAVMGELPSEITAEAFVSLLKDVFHADCVRANQLLQRKIKTVALCGGAGAFVLDTAIQEKADAFVTGEMHYHEYFGHEQEIQIAVIGHYESEQYTIELLKSIIQERCNGVRCELTDVCTNPIIYL